MRLIFLYQYFKTPQMSGQTYAYEMARRFVARGHEVHMVTSDTTGEGNSWRETDEAGIHVHWHPVAYSNNMSYRRRIRAFGQFAWKAARRAMQLDGDAVYVSSPPLTMALPGVYVARRKSIPMIFEVVDLWPEMPIAVGALRGRAAIAAARWLERTAYRHSSQVVAFSPGMKDGVVRTGYPAEQVSVIPNSCDFDLFDVPEERGLEFRRRYEWLGDRPLVLYAGSLGIINGVDYLARLAADVAPLNPEVRFLVIGSGHQEESIRQTAKRFGAYEKNFFMLPRVAKQDMPAVLSATTIATSVFRDVKEMWNNSANKVFDAHAAGRPVAINHQGWHADRIRETGCGLVLDVHDTRSSAEQLVAALDDAEWLAAARQASRRVGRERFDRNKLYQRWESAVLSVIPNQPRRLAA